MDDIDDLAAAAKQAWRRPYQPKSSGSPVVLTVVIVILLLVGFGAIVWLFRPKPPAPAPAPVVVEDVAPTPDLQAEAAEVAKDRAAHALFNNFTGRLSKTMATAQHSHLQAAAAKDVTYNCSYRATKTQIHRGKDAHSPRDGLVTFAGNVDWSDEENNTSAETYKITATFADNDGTWTIVKAQSELLTHKDSAGLFGDPVKLGSIKQLTNIDWFNEAVAEAEKTGE